MTSAHGHALAHRLTLPMTSPPSPSSPPTRSSAACSCRSRRRARRSCSRGRQTPAPPRCGAWPQACDRGRVLLSRRVGSHRRAALARRGDVDDLVRHDRDARLPRRGDAARAACCRTSGWRPTGIRWSPPRRSRRSTRCPADASSSASAPATSRRSSPRSASTSRAAARCSTRRSTLVVAALPRRVPDARRAALARARSRPAPAPRAAAAAADLGRRLDASRPAPRRRARRRLAAAGRAGDGHAGGDRAHQAAPPARDARRRADRARHERAVALHRPPRRSTLGPNDRSGSPAELAEIFRGIKRLGVQHCGVRFRSRCVRRAAATRSRRSAPTSCH